MQPYLERVGAVDMISAAADLRITLAAAQLACGRLEAAWQALAPALELARASGETMPLTLAGERLLGPLCEAAWPARTDAALLAVLKRARPAAAVSARPAQATPAVPQGLSPREQQILARIAAGDSNKLIARAFDLSPHTVKRHVANILDKLGLASRGQAAAWFLAGAGPTARA
jgi:LuxR family maltose regulon positive regulatory protein